MADIIIEGIPSADKALKLMERFSDQIPFATANAINVTLTMSQEEEKQSLRDKFILRKPINRYGLYQRYANKRKLEASIGMANTFAQLQEEGGIRTPASSSSLAVPQRENLQVSLQKAIPLAKRPKGLLKKPRTFIAQMPSGKTGIWQRIGNPRTPIRLLYSFAKRATIRKALFYRKQGYDAFMKNYQGIFGTELAKAIATRR